MRKYFFFVLFLPFLFADNEGESPNPPSLPWTSGTLLAPTGTVTPLGSINMEAYAFCTTFVGKYDGDWHSISNSHSLFSLNPEFFFYIGLTSWMDINFFPQFFWNHCAGQDAVEFGDFSVGLDFQLLPQDYTPYFPGIKFNIQETFPTGKYQRLNPQKRFTDLVGAGTFATTFNLVFYKLYHIRGSHWMTNTISAAYTVNTPVSVHGLNAYGGGPGTDGRVIPGKIFEGIISFEFTLTQNWVLALDNVYRHVDATHFSGNQGFEVGKPPTKEGANSSEQISFAPAIEYNFNSQLGIVTGCWFTAWGRNSPDFRSGVFEFVYTY